MNLYTIYLLKQLHYFMQTSPSESITEYSFYLFFLVALVTQIFLPCYLGNEMIFASNDLMNSAYNSSWQIMSSDYRKLLIILMERLKQGNRINVGKLFPLSLDTFRSVVVFKLEIAVIFRSLFFSDNILCVSLVCCNQQH